MGDGVQTPVGLCGENDGLDQLGLEADHAVHVGSAQRDPYGPTHDDGGRGAERLMGPDETLDAEAAAGVRREDSHPIEREGE